jgi:hypothetical protein
VCSSDLSYGPDAGDKAATAYFRHSFESEISGEDPTAGLVIELRKDDGAIVYLNGEEVLRRGMPAGDVDADTYANFTASGSAETDYVAGDLPPGGVVIGVNVLAVEIHQVGGNSSDIVIDLSLTLTTYVTVE